jgi:hypothetical protein
LFDNINAFGGVAIGNRKAIEVENAIGANTAIGEIPNFGP